jgi:hypothetical protein
MKILEVKIIENAKKENEANQVINTKTMTDLYQKYNDGTNTTTSNKTIDNEQQ